MLTVFVGCKTYAPTITKWPPKGWFEHADSTPQLHHWTNGHDHIYYHLSDSWQPGLTVKKGQGIAIVKYGFDVYETWPATKKNINYCLVMIKNSSPL